MKFDALSKTDGGTIMAPVDLALGSTIGGVDIPTGFDISGKSDVGHTHTQTDIADLTGDLAAKAPIASPDFTGTPLAPTAAEGTDTNQIATTAFVTTAVAAVEVGGGGGGGGDDLDTTPVAATDSTLERTVPEWLAGAPVIEIAGDVILAPDHRGAWLHMLNNIGALVFLPDDWLPGQSVGVRQLGTGIVQWVIMGGATVQLPASKDGHSSISEQYEEVIFRVISNVDDTSAVWGIAGATF
jgi:hypothetical protein